MKRPPKLVAAAGVLFLLQLVACVLPTAHLRSVASDWVQLSAALLAGWASWRAHLRGRGYARSFWLMTAASSVLWATAQSISMYYFYLLEWNGPTPIASGTAFFLCFLPMFLAVLLPESESEVGVDWERVLDTFQVSLLILTLYTILVIVPQTIVAQNSPEASRLMAANLRNALLLAAYAARLVLDKRAAVQRMIRPVAGAFAVYAMGTFFANQLDLLSVYPAGKFYDLAWSLPFLLIAVAAELWVQEEKVEKSSWSFGYIGLAFVYLPSMLLPLLLLRLYGTVVKEQVVAGLVGMTFGAVIYTVRVALIGHRQIKVSEALSTSETRYRTLFDRNMAGVFRSSVQGRLLDFNDAFAEMFGYTREELLELPSSEALYFGGREERNRLIEERRRNPGQQFEVRYKKKDGSLLLAMQSVSIIRWKDGQETIEGTLLDITRRQLLEEQLRQAQKMEAVGRLAGGVAHDFNNLLTVITGYSQMQLEETQLGNPLHDHAQQIYEASQRAAALTRQLLAFSRQQVLQPQRVSLNNILSSMEKMLSRLIGEDIRVRTVCAKEAALVRVDPQQIEQVIMNLAINARDAMPMGGMLTLETDRAELDASYVKDHPEVVAGDYMRLTVSDNGVGMDRKTLARIFEPFFTTKDTGKGTGLGLATVYGVVKQSGGHIHVYSEPGIGTTFRLYFPVVEEAASEVRDARPKAGAEHRGQETILVVEDDQPLRDLAQNVLQSQGYRVFTAKNPDEVRAICTEHASAIHLLLTDVIMPQMSGKDVATLCSGLVPQLKVLYMSGYTSDVIMHHGVLEEGLAFLQKPFTPVALTAKVREVLDGSSPMAASAGN